VTERQLLRALAVGFLGGLGTFLALALACAALV
jgi:hypothetical protein